MKQRSLDEAVSLLTRWTPRRILVKGDNGSVTYRFARQEPLISQLRSEIGSSMGVGSGGGSGRPAPLALAAFDLLRRIDETSVYMYWTAGGDSYQVSRSIEHRVQHWADNASSNPEALAEATKIIWNWVDQINELFNPEHRVELQGTCPDCDVSHHLVEDEGEMIRKAALTVVLFDGGARASCGNCGSVWTGQELHDLAEHVTRVS